MNHRLARPSLGGVVQFVTLLGLAYFTLVTYRVRFHSDSATTAMIALEQLRTGSLFVKGWYYSQDFWPMFVFNPVTALWSSIGDAFLITQIQVLSQSLFVFGFSRFLLKQIDGKALSAYVLAFLFSGVSYFWSEFFFGQGQYGNVLFWILGGMCLLALYLTHDRKIFRHLALALMIVLNFYINTTSIRYAVMFSGPMIFSLLWGHCVSADSIRFDRSLQALIALILSTVLGLAGFFYLKHHFNFIDGTNGSLFVSMDRAIDFNLRTTLKAGISLVLALPEGKPLASIAGALLFARLTLLILMLKAIVQFFQANSEIRSSQRAGVADQLRHLFRVYILTLGGVALVVVLCTSANVGEIAAERYMMTPLFLAMLCATSEFGRYSDRFQAAVKALFLVAIASNVFNLYLTKPTPTGEHDRLVAFLKAHDLKEGYATYWHADVLTVLSNYRVRVYHIEDKRFEPSLFMSTQKFYCEDTQAHFILLDQSEREGFDLNSVNADAGAPRVMTFERFQVLVYDRPLRFKACG